MKYLLAIILMTLPARAQFDDATARQRARQYVAMLVRVVDWAQTQPQHSSTYQILSTHSTLPADGADTPGDRINEQPHGHQGRAFRELFVAAFQAGVITAQEARAVQDLIQSGFKQRLAVDDYRAPNGEHWYVIRFEFRRNGVARRLLIDSRLVNRNNIDVPDGVDYEVISE